MHSDSIILLSLLRGTNDYLYSGGSIVQILGRIVDAVRIKDELKPSVTCFIREFVNSYLHVNTVGKVNLILGLESRSGSVVRPVRRNKTNTVFGVLQSGDRTPNRVYIVGVCACLRVVIRTGVNIPLSYSARLVSTDDDCKHRKAGNYHYSCQKK